MVLIFQRLNNEISNHIGEVSEAIAVNTNSLMKICKRPQTVPCMLQDFGLLSSVHPPIHQREGVEENLEFLQNRNMCFLHSSQTTLGGCRPKIA